MVKNDPTAMRGLRVRKMSLRTPDKNLDKKLQLEKLDKILEKKLFPEEILVLKLHHSIEKETKKINMTIPTVSEKKPGRNEPCWCGSGKKYKKCHWPN